MRSVQILTESLRFHEDLLKHNLRTKQLMENQLHEHNKEIEERRNTILNIEISIGILNNHKE